MAYLKRVAATTILGFIAGIVCWQLGASGGQVQYTTPMIVSTILNRAFIGFVIGISGWGINYLLHGALIGALGGLQMAVYANENGFIMITVGGIVYGIVIEFVTTKLLGMPMKK
jgi:hypothetical protein